jgi:hypothetical protein
MSLEIFKQNMLSYMQNQAGISSYGDFAKKLTLEYDMAVKRGFDTVNSITVAKGNTELMEATLNGILATAFQQPSGEHPIITNMGPAFISYWTGATMSAVPPPIIPSPGAVVNIATVSSMITNPGIWQPTDIQSLEPVLITPIEDVTVTSSNKVFEEPYELTEEDIEVKKEEVKRASETINNPNATEEQRDGAREYVDKTQKEIDTKQANSIESNEPINSTPVKIDGNIDTSCPIGLKVVEFAKKDVGILETGTKANKGAGLNYGGNQTGGETPPGKPGRIDIMVQLAGLDNQGQVRATGEGYYWCAAAVTAWWKSAGLKTPPGAASCKNWATWGKKNGTYTKTPKIGAAALYGPEGKEHHIGVVAAISKDGKITTIEGNTGGGGFNRNGCGCFVKTPRVSTISGFVIPPTCVDKK